MRAGGCHVCAAVAEKGEWGTDLGIGTKSVEGELGYWFAQFRSPIGG